MSAAGLAPPLAVSELDSRRFGLRIARGTLDGVDHHELLEQVIGQSLDVAIIRVPAGQAAPLQRLARYGMPPIHADTLLYYQCALDTVVPAPLRNTDLVFAEATPSDKDELGSLVATTFSGYSSHYHANPLFPADAILAGYVEWAQGYVSGTAPGRVTWVARRGGALVAFACCSWEGRETCEGVLYGVHPAHVGGGLYGDLIRNTQAQFKARGFATMKVSTQAWNLAVQKVWVREGFQLANASDTFHVNSLLSAGQLLVDRELRFDAGQVARFARATGDTNAIHLDEDAARASGFAGTVVHGMLGGSELSRVFGTEIPGAGTVLLRSDLVFMKPIYCDRPHRLRIRYLTASPLSGHVPAVATLHDGAGALCMLAYSDLLKRGEWHPTTATWTYACHRDSSTTPGSS